MSPTVPRFSIVCATSDAEFGQSSLFASLKAQSLNDALYELITVDPDVTSLTEALNLGIEQAKAEWITFARSQDLLDKNYLERVANFFDKNPNLNFATARVVLQEGNAKTGLKAWKSRSRQRVRNLAKGRSQTDAKTDAVVDLAQQPSHYPYSAANGFFRRDKVLEYGVQFNPELSPLFADVAFTAQYVLNACSSQVGSSPIGYVGSAVYTRCLIGTRKQEVQARVSDPRFFDQVPRYGYLALLQQATEKLGKSPLWLNRLVLDELDTHFSSDELVGMQTAAIGPVATSFLKTIRELVPYLDVDQVQNYQPDRSRGPWTEFLLHGLGDETWHLPYVIATKQADTNDAVKLSYHFSGQPPSEEFTVDGRTVEPLASKIRSYRYFENDVLYERIAWLPSGTRYGATVNDSEVLVRDFYCGPLGNLPPRNMASRLLKWERKLKNFSLRNRFKSWMAAPDFINKEFDHAWVVCDRLANSSDSGEVLFKHLRTNRPDINAWFMITAGTPDSDRLMTEGYGDRMLTPSSFKWHKAMRRASILASTHWTRDIFEPAAIADTYKPKFRQVFLQHGVIHRDLSNWLNPKDISAFVTSTPAEHESIVGDFSPYVFTERETKLTGLPRFDEHQRVAERTPSAQKNLILFAPTWRRWLTLPADPQGRQARRLREGFESSEFWQNWSSVLCNPSIAQAVERAGYVLGFMPHPNMRADLGQLDLPSHIELFSFLDQPPQEIFARTRLLVTDYSSIAFDLAYLETPTVYFQFDHERFESRGHNGRPGYYSYVEDGFGPVATDAESLVTEVVALINNDGRISDKYSERINRAFPVRDGLCTERVISAIEQLQ